LLSGLSGSVDIVSFLFLVFFSEGRNAKHLQQRQIRGSQGGRVPHACPQGVKVPGNVAQSSIHHSFLTHGVSDSDSLIPDPAF
jgi:hypothetical protein